MRCKREVLMLHAWGRRTNYANYSQKQSNSSLQVKATFYDLLDIFVLMSMSSLQVKIIQDHSKRSTSSPYLFFSSRLLLPSQVPVVERVKWWSYSMMQSKRIHQRLLTTHLQLPLMNHHYRLRFQMWTLVGCMSASQSLVLPARWETIFLRRWCLLK